SLGRFQLTGTLDGVTRAGCVDYRPGQLKAGDWTTTWIRHLVLHCVAPPEIPRRSWFVGRDEREIALDPVENAQASLARLADRYWDGLHRPLPYLPRSALAALDRPKDALGTARRTWEGSGWDGDRPESAELYMALAFRGLDPIGDEFLALAHEILGPAKAASA